jgi:hypothetical protein
VPIKLLLGNFAFYIFFISLQSCDLSSSNTQIKKNGEIQTDKRIEIGNLNSKLISGIKENDTSIVFSLMSAVSLKKNDKALKFMILSGSELFNSGNFSVLDEYYIQNPKIGSETIISSGIQSENGYHLNFVASNRESYITLLLVNGSNVVYLVTVIYELNDNIWKLSNLVVGPYSLFEKTAIDNYNLAKSFYNKLYLIDADNSMFVTKTCLKPAANIFHYEKEKEIEEFDNYLSIEIKKKYPYPITLQDIPTKPSIFNIYPQDIDEGFFPMVCYLTKISLDDTTLLSRENEMIKKEIGNVFNGIKMQKKYVFYRAFNSIPSKDNLARYHGFKEMEISK